MWKMVFCWPAVSCDHFPDSDKGGVRDIHQGIFSRDIHQGIFSRDFPQGPILCNLPPVQRKLTTTTKLTYLMYCFFILGKRYQSKQRTTLGKELLLMILVSRLSFYTSWQIKKVSQNTEYSSENTGGPPVVVHLMYNYPSCVKLLWLSI